MRAGERQVAPDLSGIRRDHTARYEFAAKHLPPGSSVLDLACGIGYGAKILAERGHKVMAVDCAADALAYGAEHYAHPLVSRFRCDAGDAPFDRDAFGAVVCFETIEHLADPRQMLRNFHAYAPMLLASVPNEECFPFRNYRFHFRHYTRSEFEELLRECGWEVVEWWGQEGPESEVERNVNGRTAIVVAKRASKRKRTAKRKQSGVNILRVVTETVRGAIENGELDAPRVIGTRRVLPPLLSPQLVAEPPRRVAIVGLGPSIDAFVSYARRSGGKSAICDEVWGINAVGDVLKCDRIFHMDDVRIQEIRAKADPTSNIANMLKWMRKDVGVPIYTSRSHPDYPSLVDFPLADVLNSCDSDRYFNSTAAYAVAFAVHIGVSNIQCYGMDFTYPNAHDAERGRGCVEYWLGKAKARGILISTPKMSSLLDGCVKPEERLYGYDTVNVRLGGTEGNLTVTLEERTDLPTAEEIEHRYDHSRHPSPLAAS